MDDLKFWKDLVWILKIDGGYFLLKIEKLLVGLPTRTCLILLSHDIDN